MSQTPSTSIPLHLLPLGFRFRPTDEELINYYLKLKIKGRINPSDADAIAEVDVCRFEPWDLPARSAIRSDDPEWFFFAPVDRKYPSGNRSNRATEAGYWKATGKDRFIRSRTPGGTGVVGMKKTLVFHMGRAPRGERTHWIMHEYRTVEREFEEGGFVLCRLFRKPVETVSQTFTPEPEESGFSPTLTKSSPSNTLHIDDVVEGEFAASLNEKTPESNMQEKSQLLPDTINNQLTESKLDDKAYYLIPYPNKTEESHSNGNMTTDEGGQIAKRKDAALYDELLGFLGPEYEHLLSDEFPQTKAICSDVDQGILTKIQYPKLEEDSVLDFLESIISTPEMSYGLSGNETCSATEAAPQQYNVVHEGSWNSLMDNDTCSSRVADSEALFAQGGEGLEALSQGRRLFGTSRSLQLDTSNRHNEIRRSLEVVHSIKRRGSRKLTAPIESGTLPAHSTKHAEDSVGQTNSLETEINIRLRNLENLESSTDFTRQQGTAERRIKLQSLKPIEKKLKLRNSDYTRLPLNIVTDEVDKDIKNQTADNEISEPAVFGDFELHSCDNDFSADIQIALCLQEVEKPSLRSRQREMSVADNKMEGSSLHEATSRVGSIPTHRIGVAVLVIASLICAGAVWFLNY